MDSSLFKVFFLFIFTSLGGSVGIALIIMRFIGRRIEEDLSNNASLNIEKKLAEFQKKLESDYYFAIAEFNEKTEAIKVGQEVTEQYFRNIKYLAPQHSENDFLVQNQYSLGSANEAYEKFVSYIKRNNSHFSEELRNELDEALKLYNKLSAIALDGMNAPPISTDELDNIENRIMAMFSNERNTMKIALENT